MDNSNNSKRIAKNTLILYIRMLFLMVIGLYTSRVVLESLGVEDYGVYNVVGGVVSVFTILSGSLTAAISRFITFEIGKDNHSRLNIIFCSAINIQLVLGLIISFLIELIGVWFLNTQMDIKSDRLVAANWVLQISLFTFVVNLLSVPYNALIIAHEKMSAFAYIGIIEGVGKAIIALLISRAPIDKLIWYAFLMGILSILIRVIYQFYCKNHFAESKYRFQLDKPILKELFSFAGWNFLGSSSGILANQGVNLLMNLFFGVVANASRGVAIQVDHVIGNFVSSFMSAINPQITKSYARKDFSYMHELMVMGAKYSYFIMLFLILPIMVEAEIILQLWLKVVPEYAVIFLRWTLVISMTYALSHTLITGMLATGNIKKYQVIISSISYTILPVTYVLYLNGASSYVAYLVVFVVYVIELFVRIWLLNEMVSLPIGKYFKEVIFNILIVTIISSLLPIILIHEMKPSIVRLFFVSMASFLSTSISVYIVGFSNKERLFVKEKSIILINKIITR